MSKTQYHQNGKPITNPSVNSLSGIAYFYTKGIDGRDRITTERLVEVLAGLGVKDPRGSSYEVTLPNGRVIKAVAGAVEGTTRQAAKAGTATKKAAAPKKPGAEAKAAKVATASKKAAGLDQMKDATKKLERAGRRTGAHRITVTRDNAAAILAMTLADIRALPDEPRQVTPLPKQGKGSRQQRPSGKGAAAHAVAS